MKYDDDETYYEEIIEGKRYSTHSAKSDAAASTEGAKVKTNTNYLYKTKKGNYFIVKVTLKVDGDVTVKIAPITKDEAKKEYKNMTYKYMDYMRTFDEAEENIEDA